MNIALIWVGLIVSMFSFLYLCDVLFYIFCWTFCKVDDYLQERHWNRMKADELKMFPEGEEMAA